MGTRRHRMHVDLPAPAARAFAMLHTPSAIRSWWSASRAIVLPRRGGVWVATWGDQEDEPDYITAAAIAEFEPTRRLVLTEFRYHARTGPLPFEASFTTTFDIDATIRGCRLTVTQDGFPDAPVADEFYAACEAGWKETFDGMRRYLGRVT